MKHEALPDDQNLVHEAYDLVERYRTELEAEAEHTRESPNALIDQARINLESYGRAFLDLGKSLPRAIELLGMASALDKADIRDAIRTHLDQLRRSHSEDDQKTLIELSQALVETQRRSSSNQPAR